MRKCYKPQVANKSIVSRSSKYTEHLVSHPLFPVLFDNLPILLPAANAAGLSILDHYKENGSTCQSDKGSGDKAVLVSHVFDPGSNPKTN